MRKRNIGNTPKGVLHISRCNSVWLECLLWEQDAAGSSPVTSTIFQELKLILSSFFFAKKINNPNSIKFL